MKQSDKKLKIGLIGLGKFGEKYARIISESPIMELTAICSRSAERSEEIAALCHPGYVLTDYLELIRIKEIEAVCIVTEANRHAEITLESLAEGKHVFVEKPLSAAVEDHKKVIEMSEKRNLTVLVGYLCRYLPNFVELKNLIDDNAFGRIAAIASRRNAKSSYLNLPRFKGNVPPLIIEPGIHTSDLFLWLTGSDVQSVYAEKRSLLGHSIADTWMAIVKMKNGVIGTMEQVFLLPEGAPTGMDHRLEIIGTKMTADFLDNGSDYNLWGQESVNYVSPYKPQDIYGKLLFCIKDELNDFVDSIVKGRKPSGAGPRDCRAAVQLASAAVQSADSGQVIVFK